MSSINTTVLLLLASEMTDLRTHVKGRNLSIIYHDNVIKDLFC